MRTIYTFLLCFAVLSIKAQQASPFVKFGKITVEDLQKTSYAIDTGASAVILSDIGETAIEGNSKGWFSANFKRHLVVHILNKNGYDEAEMEIPLYRRDGEEEKLDNLKAVTYNLVNGKIVETKLNKSEIFTKKESENLVSKKFTMPAVKEGSIIEIQYTVLSDFIDILDPWRFQGASPTLWSEITLSVPQFFTYSFLSHGYHRMFISDKKDRVDNFTVRDNRGVGPSDVTTFTSGVTDYRWVMTDVPAIREESFTSSLKNHLAAIDFQLSSFNRPLTPQNFRGSWTELTQELMKSENFGRGLSASNWLSDEIKPLIAGVAGDMEKAKKLYAYVRDNFSANDNSGIFLTQSLKNVYKSKKGSSADINLLLISMLRNAGLTAEPVVLSTTDHGYVMQASPMLTSFNYVVPKLKIGDTAIYLDAAKPQLGFGKLLPEYFNGHARIVDAEATPVDMNANQLKNRTVTSLLVINNEKGGLSGAMNQTPGYYQSVDIRSKIKSDGQEKFFKEVEKDLGVEVKLSNTRVDSLTKFDEPVAIHYDLELDAWDEDIVYLNPMFGEGYTNNPFKSAQRYYPVEMPYTIDETFLLTMDIPAGYVVDELPGQLVAKLDESGSAFFEYRISQSGSTISLRSRTRIDKTLFLPDEYEGLREFFNMIVSKHKQQIVFKKKK